MTGLPTRIYAPLDIPEKKIIAMNPLQEILKVFALTWYLDQLHTPCYSRSEHFYIELFTHWSPLLLFFSQRKITSILNKNFTKDDNIYSFDCIQLIFLCSP